MPLSSCAFIAHQGTQAGPVLQEFVRHSTGAAALGATVFMPRYFAGRLEEMCTELDPRCDYVLADPETHRMSVPFSDRGRGRRDYRYLSESDPVANSRRFVHAVLLAQANVGRTALISPWLVHGLDPSPANLNATLRWARTAQADPLVADRDLLIGMAITDAVARSDTARDDFLDEVTELDPTTLYLRISVNATQSFTQYRDDAVLTGFGTLINALVSNGFTVLLPQSGLVGWLMFAFGGRAFGAGINNSLQSFVPPTAGFGRPPLEWYFYEPLLGFVLRTEIPMLNAALGQTDCTCRYCATLPLGGSGAWNANRAGLHVLSCCRGLASEVAASTDARATVQTRVHEARGRAVTLAGSGLVLDPRSVPHHLAAWSRVVP